MLELTAHLLAAWREAERELAAAAPGTPAFEAAIRQMEACRGAYHARLAELADVRSAGEASPD
ncbi:MAG TPA: hypothetical protein VMU89_11690 [Thermomicrobiaceae bacterium]|nr:hypothetical protein [Thermomicrobiaceae bacterium]